MRRLKGEGNKNDRREKLKEAIYQRFEFTEMAKRSLGGFYFSDPALDANAGRNADRPNNENFFARGTKRLSS